MMLRAVPTSFLSWDFEIFDGAARVAAVDVAWLREGGTVDILGTTYTIGREGLFSGAFFLKKQGEAIVLALKPSPFRRLFEVQVGTETYTLRAASWFRRNFVLRRGEQTVGTIRPVHWFARKARVDLPNEIPLEAQVFMTWLVIILWRRQQQSSNST